MGVSIGPDFRRSRAAADLVGLLEADDWVLLVMGDGSARRDEALRDTSTSGRRLR